MSEDIYVEIEEVNEVTTSDHAQLINLDYESSGHTGFVRKIHFIWDNLLYKLKAQILDESDNVIFTSNEVDLPIEELVKDIRYYETYVHEGVTYHKVIVFELKSGAVTIIPVGDIISGLASTDYVDNQISIVNGRIDAVEDDIETIEGNIETLSEGLNQVEQDIQSLDNRVDVLENKPYISLERLANYLYKVTFDSIPEYEEIAPVVAGCTAFVRNGKLYRNLDWNYDETATFKVVTKEYIGVGFINGLNDSNLDDNKIGQLPYHLVDGKNNNGIMLSTHVLFNDWQYTGSGSKDKLLTQLPHYILSNLKSINEINSVLGSYLQNIKVPQALVEMGYLVQYLVTDGTTTYAILPPTTSSGNYSVVNITSNPKLTNFRWVDRSQVVRTESDIQDRPTGIERWNLVNESVKLEDLRFTKCYETPDRLSEFIGIDETTKSSSDAELEAIYERARALYLTRTRNGATWQTVHSVVYSINGMESLFVQENFAHDYASESDELKSLIEAETQAREQADNSLDARVEAIEDDYLTSNDKNVVLGLLDAEVLERQQADTGLSTRIGTIESDYLKEADKTELSDAISDEAQERKDDVADLQSSVEEVDDKLNQNVEIIKDGTYFTYSGDTVTLNIKYRNLKTGVENTKTETISLANGTTAGLMSPTSVLALQQMRSEIDALEGQNIRLSYTIKDNPTANEISMFVIASGYSDTSKWGTIGVVVKNTNHIWRFYTNTNNWQDIGLDTVNQFTNLIAGIIKGSENDGQVYAEDDGTGSVVGWDELKNRVLAIETELPNLQPLITASNKLPYSLISGTPTPTEQRVNEISSNTLYLSADVGYTNAVCLLSYNGSKTIYYAKSPQGQYTSSFTVSANAKLLTIIGSKYYQIIDFDNNGNQVLHYGMFGNIPNVYYNSITLPKQDEVTLNSNARHTHSNKAILDTLTDDQTSLDAKFDAKADASDIPTALSDLNDDSTHRLVTDTEKSTWNEKMSNTKTAVQNVGGLVVPLNTPTEKLVAGVDTSNSQVMFKFDSNTMEIVGDTSPYTIRAKQKKLYLHTVKLDDNGYESYWKILSNNNLQINNWNDFYNAIKNNMFLYYGVTYDNYNDDSLVIIGIHSLYDNVKEIYIYGWTTADDCRPRPLNQFTTGITLTDTVTEL